MRITPWSGGSKAMPPRNFFDPFCNLLWILCVRYIKTIVLEIRILYCFWERKLYCRILYFFLRIVKSLQHHGRRQIVKSCKYCLVWLFFFGVYFFSLFLHLTDLEISYIFPSKRLLEFCFVGLFSKMERKNGFGAYWRCSLHK